MLVYVDVQSTLEQSGWLDVSSTKLAIWIVKFLMEYNSKVPTHWVCKTEMIV